MREFVILETGGYIYGAMEELAGEPVIFMASGAGFLSSMDSEPYR